MSGNIRISHGISLASFLHLPRKRRVDNFFPATLFVAKTLARQSMPMRPCASWRAGLINNSKFYVYVIKKIPILILVVTYFSDILQLVSALSDTLYMLKL